jgi:hypothetical protein
MREHNYPARLYEYVINNIHNMFTDTEADQTIEDVIREYMRMDTVEEPAKKDINNFKFLSK